MFTLDEVIPWGRSFDEYRRMFALSDGDLRVKMLGCGDGPAAFNATATSQGASVCSCDPLYGFTAAEIRARIEATAETVLEQTRRNADQFVWTSIGSVDELRRLRMASMETFLADYPTGKAAGRYVDAALPTLPFDDQSFDLAFCSHFLFLYGDQLGEDFHLKAVHEMCRVAKECRIFPLLALGGRPSPFVEPVMNALREGGVDVAVERVPYEFQRGGNEMLRIRSVDV